MTNYNLDCYHHRYFTLDDSYCTCIQIPLGLVGLGASQLTLRWYEHT